LDPQELLKRYSGQARGKLDPGGPEHSDCSSDEELRKAYTYLKGPHVFYSGIGKDSTDPLRFAQEVGGVTLPDAFPKNYVNPNKRSIEWREDFWDRASGVFAELATGDAYFVTEFAQDTVMDIWSRIERPTLEASSSINTITLVDRSNFKDRKVIYRKSSNYEADPAADKPAPTARPAPADKPAPAAQPGPAAKPFSAVKPALAAKPAAVNKPASKDKPRRDPAYDDGVLAF
jgi:hypothetical protein